MKEVQFVTVTTTQLQELISEGLKNELNQLRKELREEEKEKLLTREETAEALSIGLSTLSKWTSQGKIPSYGLGGRIYYKHSDVLGSLVSLNQVKRGGQNA